MTTQSQTKYTYQAIAEKLRQRILDNPQLAGQQLPPEPQLASDYGVSRITLRKALDILGDEHLVVRQKGRGTFVADSVADAGVKTLVYIGRVDGHLWRDLYMAALTEAQRQGYSVATVLEQRLGQAEQRRAIEQELATAAAAIVTSQAWAQVRAAGLQVPVQCVVLGPELVGSGVHSVAADFSRAAQVAVETLVAVGHRRLLWCGSTPAGEAVPGVPLPSMRSNGAGGFVAGLVTAGIAFDRRYMMALSHDDAGLATLNRLWDALPEKPTAIICDADFRTVPVYKMARQRGLRIPEDLSIVALGNTPWCEMLDPALSSVSIDEDAIARTAVGLVSSAAGAPLHLRVTPRLIRRSSIGAPPSAA